MVFKIPSEILQQNIHFMWAINVLDYVLCAIVGYPKKGRTLRAVRYHRKQQMVLSARDGVQRKYHHQLQVPSLQGTPSNWKLWRQLLCSHASSHLLAHPHMNQEKLLVL